MLAPSSFCQWVLYLDPTSPRPHKHFRPFWKVIPSNPFGQVYFTTVLAPSSCCRLQFQHRKHFYTMLAYLPHVSLMHEAFKLLNSCYLILKPFRCPTQRIATCSFIDLLTFSSEQPGYEMCVLPPGQDIEVE